MFLYILAEIVRLYNAGAVKHPLQIRGTAWKPPAERGKRRGYILAARVIG